MDKPSFPRLASVLLITACARTPQYDVMSAPVVCDSLPLPLRPGERVGATVPAAHRPTLDSVVVIGTVLEASSGRPLSGATIGLLPASAPDRAYQPLARAYTDAEAGFVLVAPRPGRYALVAHVIGHLPARQEVTLQAGEVATARLEMRSINCPGY